MAIGLIGKKSGMTRIFNEEGVSVPVTVIEAEPNRVTQVKSLENDGYVAIQVTTGERRRSRVTKAMAGHFAKAKILELIASTNKPSKADAAKHARIREEISP